MTFPSAEEFEAERGRAYRGFVKLVKNAKAAGRLRADFAPQDLPMILMANAGVVRGAGAPDAWRRLVGYLLQACAAERAEPLPAAPPARQVYRALRQIGRPGGQRRELGAQRRGPEDEQAAPVSRPPRRGSG